MRLEVDLFGTTFPNPVLLAAGTCGFGREVVEVVDLRALGGFVTKSVTWEPRWGNPAPRVAEFSAGMVNSVGLANPGARRVLEEKLPWVRDHLRGVPVLVSVAGHTAGEFFRIVELLEDGPGFLGFELNLSCPNDERRTGLPFALDPEALGRVVEGVRERSGRPLWVKLAPDLPDPAPAVRAAEEAGADALTLANTLPGLVLDPLTGRPALGAGPGGVSGPALRAVALNSVARARELTALPVVGVGGIGRGVDAAQFLRAGASLVQVGTASFWDPRAAERVARELYGIGRRQGVERVTHLVGARETAGG